MPEDEPIQNQTMTQKKIAFANSGHLDAVLALLRNCTQRDKLVGETEYATIVNAVTLDAQAQLIMDFINTIDRVKRGDLLTDESNG